MSLILDALSRAEREKREQPGLGPGILSQESQVSADKAASGPWLWLGAIVMLLFVFAIAIYVLRGEPFSELSPSETASPLPPSESMAMPRRLASAGGPAAAPINGPPDKLPDSRPSADRSRDRAPAVEARAPREGMSAGNDAAVAALYDSVPKVSGDAAGVQAPLEETGRSTSVQEKNDSGTLPVGEQIDVATVMQELNVRAKENTLAAHPAPLLGDLSKQFKDRVPTLMYSRHDYNPRGRSLVVINGESLAPGQRSRGVEVREILADSVVLRFEGSDFRLRSLNSWVNL